MSSSSSAVGKVIFDIDGTLVTHGALRTDIGRVCITSGFKINRELCPVIRTCDYIENSTTYTDERYYALLPGAAALFAFLIQNNISPLLFSFGCYPRNQDIFTGIFNLIRKLPGCADIATPSLEKSVFSKHNLDTEDGHERKNLNTVNAHDDIDSTDGINNCILVDDFKKCSIRKQLAHLLEVPGHYTDYHSRPNSVLVPDGNQRLYQLYLLAYVFSCLLHITKQKNLSLVQALVQIKKSITTMRQDYRCYYVGFCILHKIDPKLTFVSPAIFHGRFTDPIHIAPGLQCNHPVSHMRVSTFASPEETRSTGKKISARHRLQPLK